MLTWNFDLVPVAGFSHSIVAGAIESPRSMANEGGAIDVSGGGYWQLELRRAQLYGESAEGHRLWLRYRAELDGGAGKIVIPLIDDLLAAPVATTFSDGTPFSDGTSFVSAAVAAEFATAAPLAAGTVTLAAWGDRLPREGDVFAVDHAGKSWHAYQIRDIDSVVAGSGGVSTVTVSIRPTLREATPARAVADFYRPRCVFRLPAGASMAWEPEKYWRATPTVRFVEALR